MRSGYARRLFQVKLAKVFWFTWFILSERRINLLFNTVNSLSLIIYLLFMSVQSPYLLSSACSSYIKIKKQ